MKRNFIVGCLVVAVIAVAIVAVVILEKNNKAKPGPPYLWMVTITYPSIDYGNGWYSSGVPDEYLTPTEAYYRLDKRIRQLECPHLVQNIDFKDMKKICSECGKIFMTYTNKYQFAKKYCEWMGENQGELE